ncbi:MAG: HlyC/CorC family transporter [Anaerolineae bacterium]|nr:HlyC/CorC family transporter [Anaerolineae bacterium]
MSTALGILAVFALVFLNGFFVAAEFSFVGARRTRLAQLAEEGSGAARAAQNAISHLDQYIAATQLGITLASLGLGWIGEPAVAHVFEPLFERFLPEDVAMTLGHTISVVIAFSLVTMLHIVLGELAPKSIALQRPEEISMIVARPTILFHDIFNPVIRLMNGVGNGVVRLLGFEPAGEHQSVHSPEELEMLVHSSREAGLLEASEEALLRRVFDFADIPVVETMQPRVEVDAIAIDIPLAELLQRIAADHHSRYPVYHDHIDNLVGILNVRDVFDLVVSQPSLLTDASSEFDVTPLLREPLYVPATMGVDKVLEEMRRQKTQLAIVIDEYGGMAGLATMEDIIEELVGEVEDEFDAEASGSVEDADPNVIDGLTSMTDVVERFGDPGGETESMTVGGYVAERLERIPAEGDTLPFGDYRLDVVEMDGMRVARVRFTREAPLPGSASDASERTGAE